MTSDEEIFHKDGCPHNGALVRWCLKCVREEKKLAREDSEKEIQKLRDALIQVKLAIEKNARDTIWFSDSETLCDYIEKALEVK